MKRLILESSILLLHFEWILRFREFRELHRRVHEAPVLPTTMAPGIPVGTLATAIDYACVFYFKQVLCLQRSAATTVFLRRHGWSAEMVIGAQMLPFKSHAWCEIDGAVVNDKPYVSDIYTVLERC